MQGLRLFVVKLLNSLFCLPTKVTSSRNHQHGLIRNKLLLFCFQGTVFLESLWLK
uniref:Uncharacterized protein n=1 Tax=Arundo donax TaxID=35708 RepID=A0A0A9GRY6_ARUDO